MKYSTNDQGIIRDEDDNFVGVNIGWDFTAEHEWGSGGIFRLLGIQNSDKVDGPDRYLIGNDDNIRSGKVAINNQEWFVIRCERQYGYGERDLKDFLPGYWSDDQDVIGAWSGDSGFVVGVKDQNVHDMLLEAIDNCDLIVTGRSLFAREDNPFSGNGMKLMVRSLIPQEWTQAWIEADQAARRLEKAVNETGIKKRLEKAGRRYYALKPHWFGDDETDLRFFLNPCEQQENNFGWFTVEELDQWIKGEGPIPKHDAKV